MITIAACGAPAPCTRHVGCERDERREALRTAGVNGIDFVEVATDRTTLHVTFLHKLGDLRIKAVDVTIDPVSPTAGRPVRATAVERCGNDDPKRDDCVRVTLDCPVGPGCYSLCIAVGQGEKATRRLDPGFSCATFRGDAGGVTDVDCVEDAAKGPTERLVPAIDYLARDYGTIRQSILDRLAVTMPDWRERHAPDVGITLVEALAYVGDRMHYALDSVATEAYLPTARRRISVRRHVRLVDYTLFEGSNARTWIVATVESPLELPAAEITVITDHPDLPPVGGGLSAEDLQSVPPGSDVQTFAPIAGCDEVVRFRPDWNRIRLYAWGRSECCLPAGSTRATLEMSPDTASSLGPGSLLLLEEVISPATGSPFEVDRSRRQVVRLTQPPQRAWDPLERKLTLYEVAWHREDALGFDLCLAAIGPAPECRPLHDLSVARANVVLVDHGRWVEGTVICRVPPVDVPETCACGCGTCAPSASTAGQPIRPTLDRDPLVFAPERPPSGHDRRSAAALLRPSAATTLPELVVVGLAFADPEGAPAEIAPDRTSRDCAGVGAVAEELGRRVDDLIDLAERLACQPRGATPVVTRDDWNAWAEPVLCRQLPQRLRDRLCPPPGAVVAVPGVPAHGPAPLLVDKAAAPEDAGPDDDALLDLEDAIRQRLTHWWPKADLLASGPDDAHVVVEVDEDRRPHLRFGDGELGRAPEAGAVFLARRRLGGGPVGNVGAGAITRLVWQRGRVPGVDVTNPLAAFGGTAPETLDHARWVAPVGFRRGLERAITADDYATIARRADADVQAAGAELEWMGSWFEAFVVLDELGSGDPDKPTLRQVQDRLERVRRLGHDLRVAGAIAVPIDLALVVCIADDALPGDVRAALAELFGTGRRADGSLAYFHPDRWTPGQPVRISDVIVAALSLDGVTSVEVTQLRRVGLDGDGPPDTGVFQVAPDEIVRIDDAGPRGHGSLSLTVRGGR